MKTKLVSWCSNCGYNGDVIDFFDYNEGAFPKQYCPSCGSEKIITKKQNRPAITGRVCQFCGEREIKYFSFNSTREDFYFSEHLTCCENDTCKEALKKKVISHDGNPKFVLISFSSIYSFTKKDRKKVSRFLKKIILSHPR